MGLGVGSCAAGRVDGRPASSDVFTGHIWPPVGHLTVCDCVGGASTSTFFG